MSRYNVIQSHAEYLEALESIETDLNAKLDHAQIVESIMEHYYSLDEDTRYFYLVGAAKACWDYKIPSEPITIELNRVIKDHSILTAVSNLGDDEGRIKDLVSDVEKELLDIKKTIESPKKRKKRLPKKVMPQIEEGDLWAYHNPENRKWYYFFCIANYHIKKDSLYHIILSEHNSEKIEEEDAIMESSILYMRNYLKKKLTGEEGVIASVELIFHLTNKDDVFKSRNLRLIARYTKNSFLRRFPEYRRDAKFGERIIPSTVNGKTVEDQINLFFKYSEEKINQGSAKFFGFDPKDQLTFGDVIDRTSKVDEE